MWQEDISSNLASVAASQAAEAHGESGWMDQFHADDFLMYAYLQSGQEARAKAIAAASAKAIAHYEKMPDMHWARTIADGHLHQAQQARSDLAAFDALTEELKKGDHAYLAESVGVQIRRGQMLAWLAFAAGDTAQAVKEMRASADLQDKVGQAEVDIPAREMLGDILLEAGRPREALGEYKQALHLSPNRFNGLFNAGKAAEAAGSPAEARAYYATLLKITDNGSQSARAEIGHAKAFVATASLASK
jgi:tetratricopeptide (TPR) repeat protein